MQGKNPRLYNLQTAIKLDSAYINHYACSDAKFFHQKVLNCLLQDSRLNKWVQVNPSILTDIVDV